MIQKGTTSAAPVALISMPWASPTRPSIALGIIKAQLASSGISSEVLYPCIDLACSLGFGFYDRMAALDLWPFLGEWLFTRAAFGADAVGEGPSAVEAWIPHDGVAEQLHELMGDGYAERLSLLREQVIPAYCERLAEGLSDRAVLGFSCTFNQLIPALGAGRAVKQRNPDVRILLGGPQSEGFAGKELLRALPWVDAVYEGEFEVAGVETVRWALGQRDEPPIEYVSHRVHEGIPRLATGVAVLGDMDRSPMPDYDEFFRDSQGAKDLTGQPLQIGTLPFESSRGCWWGQRRHCTFCGLNGRLMRFRSKSPERVLEEVLVLASRHQQVCMAAVDNIIDHEYLRTLLPRLRERDLGLELFYETKANLKREDVRLYHEAGLSVIQPGIESFSSHVLDLMRKGTSALRNVYLLKLCRQYGVQPVYNILLGFPGETVEDHRQQTEWIQRMHHFLPPAEACRFVLQRHSPMFEDSGSFGLENVRPSRGYRHVFPPELIDLEKIAFYYDFDLAVSAELKHAQKKVMRAVRRWKRRWLKGARAPELVYRNAGDFVLVIDGRSTQTGRKYLLRGLSRDVLLACDDPISLGSLSQRLGYHEDLEPTIESLLELGLILREGNTLLGLAIPHSKCAQLPFVADVLPDAEPAHLREKRRPRGGSAVAEEATSRG
ncbi:MAG: RiPP maturation radical SAM protein 1 [Planctomycetes bacterium]|nr:RiPP maturation radical SAM protein 1 [Planctomycetota bacterium]